MLVSTSSEVDIQTVLLYVYVTTMLLDNIRCFVDFMYKIHHITPF